MKWMEETRKENGTPSAPKTLPTIEDSALLAEARGGADTWSWTRTKMHGLVSNGGVSHEDSRILVTGGVIHEDS